MLRMGGGFAAMIIVEPLSVFNRTYLALTLQYRIHVYPGQGIFPLVVTAKVRSDTLVPFTYLARSQL